MLYEVGRYGRSGKSITAGGDTEPVSVDELKQMLEIDFPDKNEMLTRLLKAARQHIENKYGITIVASTIKVYYDYWVGSFELPFGPVRSVTSVKTWDGTKTLNYNSLTKSLEINASKGVELTYEVGFEEVPEDLKHAILKEACTQFYARTDFNESTNFRLLGSVASYVKPYVNYV